MAENIVPKDFVFNSDRTHARLSRRGVASLLKISHTAVNKALKSGNLFTVLEAKTIEEQGFEGGNLIKLIKHFAMSTKAKPETRLHCWDLFEKMAIVGAQIFIDSLAGIDPAQPQPCRILGQAVPWKRLYEKDFCDRVFKWFGAQFYWDFAYCFMTPIEICKLNELNPAIKGNRKYRIHQYLDPSTRNRLEPYVLQLIAVANSSRSKQQFADNYQRHFGHCIQLNLLED